LADFYCGSCHCPGKRWNST